MIQKGKYQADNTFTIQELNALISEYNKEYQTIIGMYITGYSVAQIAVQCNKSTEEVEVAVAGFLSHCRAAVTV